MIHLHLNNNTIQTINGLHNSKSLFEYLKKSNGKCKDLLPWIFIILSNYTVFDI